MLCHLLGPKEHFLSGIQFCSTPNKGSKFFFIIEEMEAEKDYNPSQTFYS